MPNVLDERDWFTVAELAADHRFHPSTVTRWIVDGELEAYRIGKREWRIRREDWETFLARGRRNPRRVGVSA